MGAFVVLMEEVREQCENIVIEEEKEGLVFEEEDIFSVDYGEKSGASLGDFYLRKECTLSPCRKHYQSYGGRSKVCVLARSQRINSFSIFFMS